MFRIPLLLTLAFGFYPALLAKTLLIGGAATSKENFAPYLIYDQDIETYIPNANPLTSDHTKDLDALKNLLLDRDYQDVDTLVGYSVGGKFASKLAEITPRIKRLVLIDPVDGPPPFASVSDRFPVFTQGSSNRTDLKILIFQSEYGGEGFLGVPCVPDTYGPKRFLQFYQEAAEVEYVEVRNFGHTDFLLPPLNLRLRLACKKGEGIEEARLSIVQKMGEFL